MDAVSSFGVPSALFPGAPVGSTRNSHPSLKFRHTPSLATVLSRPEVFCAGDGWVVPSVEEGRRVSRGRPVGVEVQTSGWDQWLPPSPFRVLGSTRSFAVGTSTPHFYHTLVVAPLSETVTHPSTVVHRTPVVSRPRSPRTLVDTGNLRSQCTRCFSSDKIPTRSNFTKDSDC